MQKFSFIYQLVQKIEWKETDGRTNRRSRLHYLPWGSWIRGSGKRGSGNRGIIIQRWKSREWNSRHQTSGLENAAVEISGEGKVGKAKR